MTGAPRPGIDAGRLGYRPALDGLRGIAVLLVLLYHLPLGLWTAAGPTGVVMFFALSGFLITSLLLEEHDTRGAIDLPQFYKRRALRLLPAMITIMGVLVALDVVVGSEGDYKRPALLTLLYAANWAIIAGVDFGHINHTWTLAIEEHFYLLWPLTVVLILRNYDRRVLLRVAIAVAACSWAVRVALWISGASLPRVLYGTDTRLDGLLIGCILALVGWQKIRALPRGSVLAAVLMLALGITMPHHWFQFVFAYTGIAVATAVIIAGCLTSRRTAAVLDRWPLVPIGRISYGLYLWHLPIYGAVFKYAGGMLLKPFQIAAAVGLSLAVAASSYAFIERPFLRLKARRPAAEARLVGERATASS